MKQLRYLLLILLSSLSLLVEGQNFNNMPSAGSVLTTDGVLIHRSGGYRKTTVAGIPFNYGYNVKWYGATGDGSTDDVTAISNAITAAGVGGTVYVPTGTYLISTGLTLLEGQRIVGDGKLSIIKTTANIAMLTLLDYCVVENLQFLGSYNYAVQIVLGNPVDAAISNQKGIFFTQRIGISITNIWCFNVGGYGIDFTTNTTVGRQYTSSIVSNVFCINGLYGIRAASQGEFVSINSAHCTYNAYGLRLDAGNIHMNGGNFSGNIRNVWLTAGTNNGKHTFTGCVIAHSSAFSIYIANIDNGVVFTGCQISYGIITVQSSQVLFTGCEIHFLSASTDFIQSGASSISFVGTTWGSLRPTISDNVSSLGYSDITFVGCKQKADKWVVSTSNASAATVFSYLMIDNTGATFDVEILCYDPTGIELIGRFRRRFGVNKVAGAPTVQFTEDDGTDYKDPSFSTIDIIDPTISSNSVIIQVTGVAATNLRWKAILHSETQLK